MKRVALGKNSDNPGVDCGAFSCAFFSEGVDADGTAPHKASGLLRAWQKCYSEASNKEGRCCEVVLEDDCCEYEYVRLNLEYFSSFSI